jgi:hypothetical protein
MFGFGNSAPAIEIEAKASSAGKKIFIRKQL